MHPELWSAANDLAYLLSEYGDGKKDLDRALVLAEKAKSLSPDNPAAFDTLGWIYYRRGEVPQAIEWLAKAQTGNAGNAIINYHLGMAYFRDGNTAKAKEYLQIALASKVAFPGKDEAQRVIARLSDRKSKS
jgi:tetratricopeptide (TPR) repeat protein